MYKGFFLLGISIFAIIFSNIFGYYESIICTVGIWSIIANGILLIIFIFTGEKRIVKKDIKKYPLKMLGNDGKDIYLIIALVDKGERSVFSYLKESEKNILCDIEDADIKNLESGGKPYVEIYENIYKPKGLIDFLYYDKKYEKSHKIRYEVYVNDDMVKVVV